nr:pyridoxal-phosphate dependent enzyme [Cytophagales bacterium]
MNAGTLIDEIGNTPIISGGSTLLSQEFNSASFYFKVEYLNPALSIKDRTALGLVLAAEKRGLLKKGDTIVESSSGNLGHAMAMICAIKGYKFICVLDPKTPQSNINTLKAFGAGVDLVMEPDETGSYQTKRIARAKEIAASRPNTLNLDQYNNRDAIDYHAATTGPEIYGQLPDVDVIFGSLSTGSHLSGIAKYFKEHHEGVKIVGVEPAGSVISGGEYKPFLQNGTGLSFSPKNFDPGYVDYVVKVSDIDAFKTCRAIAREKGLFIGGSSGALISAMANYANEHDGEEPQKILGILPDNGVKYTTTVYDDDWMEENGLS